MSWRRGCAYRNRMLAFMAFFIAFIYLSSLFASHVTLLVNETNRRLSTDYAQLAQPPRPCHCYRSDGDEEPMCYTRPDNGNDTGRQFSCESTVLLEELDLLSTHKKDVDFEMLEFPVIVTAASSSHFQHSTRLIYKLRKFYPDIKVIFYNLGLSPAQLSDLFQVCGIEVRDFNFLMYPDYVRRLHEYRWKPLIIAEVLKDYDSLWYMDSSVVPRKGHLEAVPELIRCRDRYKDTYFPPVEVRDRREETDVHESSFDELAHSKNVRECMKYSLLLNGWTGHGIYAATEPSMYAFFPSNYTELRKPKAKMYEAGVAYVVKTNEVTADVLKWWVLCALEQDCMAPPGAQTTCFFDQTDRFTAYAGCHRYDQSALNLLLANVNHYDRHYYTSNIVDFFSVKRDIEEDEIRDLSSLSCQRPMLVNNV